MISSQPGFQHWCVPFQIKARKSSSTFQKGGQTLNRKLQTYIIASKYKVLENIINIQLNDYF